MCSLLLAACGETGGGAGAGNTPPAIVDAAAGGRPVPPREDAFVLADVRVADQGPPPDAETTPPDAAPLVDADTADAAVPVPAAPAAGGLAAGAAPLRSARYRLYAVVGPAAAVGAPLTSDRFRLESGPTLWLAPTSESPR
jgi:hypothetical protein